MKICRSAAQVHRHRQTGRQERTDRVARQEQAGQRRQAADPRQPVDGVDRRERADEGEAVEKPELEHDEPHRDDHRDGGPERGARRGPEDVRVGERVAQEALVGRAGDGQCGADEHRRQDPRQAQLHHDRLGRIRPGASEVEPEQAVRKDRHGVAGSDRNRSETHPGDQGDQQREQPEPDQQCGTIADPARLSDPHSRAGQRLASQSHVRASAERARPKGGRGPDGSPAQARATPRRAAALGGSRSGRSPAGSRRS